MISFKVGDTIKVVSRLYEDDGVSFDISDLTVRSVLKLESVEIVGVTTLIDDFTLQTVFDTTSATRGQYQTDVRFTNPSTGQSFSTPTQVVDLQARIS